MKVQLPHSLMASLCVGTTLVAGLLTQTAVADTVLVYDSFTPSDTRPAGSSLAGTMPEEEIGVATWKASHSNMYGVIAGQGGVISRWRNSNPAAGALPAEMRIGLPPAYTGGVLTVSASMITATSDWIGFGFFSTDYSGESTSAWFGSENLLSFRLQSNGFWAVNSHNGSGLVTIVSGNLSGYSPSASYSIGLSYDTASQMARVFLINGETEINLYTNDTGWFATGLSSDVSIAATGFRLQPKGNNGINSVVGDYSINDFRVVTTVPEPGSVGLVLGLGALAVGIVSRRKRARQHS